MQIIKRDGSVENFYTDKIVNAITAAMDETEKGIEFEIALRIAQRIDTKYRGALFGHIPTVEIVQDDVEQMLAEEGRFDASKRYILYREERNKKRNEIWDMDELQKDIYERKYRLKGESFDEFLTRVSGKNKRIKKFIRDKKILPAGRILAGRGLDEHGRSVTLSNCYVMPKIEDNLESIFDTAKYLAKTYSYGGGCGVNISNLRPNGAVVQNSAQTTTGATSFMDLYSMVTGLIGQKGRRKLI